MHGPVRAAATAGIGLASVKISFDAWKDGNVAPSRHQINIVAPRSVSALEAVSSRLKRALVHPSRTGTLAKLRYSLGGKRIIASDDPGGVIQVWDAESGKQLAKIESGFGYRGSNDFFSLTPDTKTVYITPRSKQNYRRFERDGKKLYRWEFDGEVCAWDVETGRLRETFKHAPPRNILAMTCAPNCSAFMTSEELPGEAEGRPKRASSLWDVKSKRYRALPGGLSSVATFSPDSKSVAVMAYDADGYTPAVALLKVPTCEQIVSIPVREKLGRGWVSGFTPDGRILAGWVRVFARRNEWHSWQDQIKLWDAASGKELASFLAQEANAHFANPVFSPDGRMLCATNWEGEQAKLYLFDVATRRLAKTVILTDRRNKVERMIVRQPAFSPDGRWIAAITQVFPPQHGNDEAKLDEVPQPRIHLVDVAEGVVRETLIAPPGFSTCACFSPDGKTLATGGSGKVLLWDLTTPPG